MEKGYSSRISGNRKEYRTLIIVCEGQKTERIYFNHYKERKSGLLIITPNSTVTDPENLVNFALRQIEKYALDLDNGDQAWCVLDADKNTDENLKKAKRLANNKVKICLSNPCFEMWYLLHFCYCNSRVVSNEVKERLEGYLPDYDKTMDYFDELILKRKTAIEYAKKLKQKHEREQTEILSMRSNPSTQVFQLVEYIMKIIDENKF